MFPDKKANPHGHVKIAPPLADQVKASLEIDDYFDTNFAVHDPKLRVALRNALDNSMANGLPGVAVSPAIGKFLMLQCRLLKICHVLEVGTLGGYSAIWFAAGAGCTVTSLEIDTDRAAVARENVDAAGVGGKVDIVVGDAQQTFRQIVDEIQEGKRTRPGLVFIDANKDAGLEYFNLGVEAVGMGGIIIVDNMVRYGLVVDPDKMESDGWIRGIRRLAETAGQDTRVEATVIRTLSESVYDGFLFAVVQ